MIFLKKINNKHLKIFENDKEKNTLNILNDQLVLPKWSTKVRLSIMLNLMDIGLVELKYIKMYDFWRLTELGKK